MVCATPNINCHPIRQCSNESCHLHTESGFNFSHYVNRFSMPSNSTSPHWYSWDMGPAHFIRSAHGVHMYILQVNKKFCELKGGNIGIVEKAQETRFG